MTNKPKLDTFIDRLSAVMLDAGVEREQLKTMICAVCGIQSVDDWFSDPAKLPPAEYIAVLSATLQSDCVWLITGKFSSKQNVCSRLDRDAEVLSCTLDSTKVEVKGLAMTSEGISITQTYQD